jgi:hypothetical protein
MKFGVIVSHKKLSSWPESRENRVGDRLYLKVLMNFYSYVPYHLTDLAEIRYRSPHNAIA